MCGRYHMGEDTLEEAIEQMQALNESEPHTGDVMPGGVAPVVCAAPKGLVCMPMRWGFQARKGGGLLINARRETALQKPAFSRSVMEHRCVMPCDAFYEWDPVKQMVTFRVPGRNVIYLAGCYNVFEGERRFVILTGEANESMRDVHPRMPMILDAEQADVWIRNDKRTRELLDAPIAQVAGTRAYEQMRLFV